MNKSIRFSCSPEIKSAICDALKLYIDSAFPKEGCADCSLVAREELLNAVKGIETGYSEHQEVFYNKRIRAFVTEAIKLYFESAYADHPDKENLCALLIKLSRGDALNQNEINSLTGIKRLIS